MLTSFVGREHEIAALEKRLDEVRLVTLVGAPGIGKTRLGLEVGARFGDRGMDACVVELAPVTDGPSVAPAVAAALELTDPPDHSAEEAVVQRLARRELLLVLDNCEHVADPVAGLLRRLLASCPSVRVLATSRTALGLSGEQVWRVPPLDVSPAVELFVDRARLSSPVAPVEQHRAVVERICARLDGLPLAIELAAAFTRVLSPEEILDRLDRALPLPPSRARDVGPRHQTMDATVEWSHRMLGPGEQLLFERLSAFAGGFDLAAAEAVGAADDVRPAEAVGAADDVLRGLTVLVDQSLVLAGVGVAGTTRYRLLEPLRQYAGARLAEREAEPDATRRRHARHYLDVALRLDGELHTPRLPEALRLVAEEDGNFRAALDFARTEPGDLGLRLCTALARSWALRGQVREGRARFEQMLEVDTADRRLRASALLRASRLAWRQHDDAATRAWLEESLSLERELDDLPRVARRLRSLAVVALTEGDLDEARRLLDECVGICRAHGDGDGLALALAFSALGLQMAGRNDEAAPYVQEALDLSRASGNIPAAVYALGAAVFGAITRGDIAELRAYGSEVGELLRAIGGLHEDPAWLWAGVVLASAEGRHRAALRLAGAADARARRDGLRFHERFARYLRPWLERSRSQVTPTEAARLGAEGGRMTADELIDEALGGPDEPGGESPLSPREAEIAELIARGRTNGEIAEHLYISKRTVETHVANIKAKLGLGGRVEIAAWVLEGRHA